MSADISLDKVKSVVVASPTAPAKPMALESAVNATAIVSPAPGAAVNVRVLPEIVKSVSTV